MAELIFNACSVAQGISASYMLCNRVMLQYDLHDMEIDILQTNDNKYNEPQGIYPPIKLIL